MKRITLAVFVAVSGIMLNAGSVKAQDACYEMI